MMKRLLMLLAVIAFTMQAQAQTVIYEDDFESYTVGQGLAAQSPWWILWPNMPDAPITTEQAMSGTKSVLLQGTNDVILTMGKVSGKYQVDFYYYVPTGFGAYYNFQRLTNPGVEWVAEVFFGNNGSGTVNAGGTNAATFTFPQNQWVYIKNVIDIDADWAELFINNNLIHGWQWSLTSAGAPSPHGGQLGGLNIFAGAPQGQTPKFYMDDVGWVELVSGAVPAVAVNPAELQIEINSGQILTEDLNVANVGTGALNYHTEINYVFSDAKRGNNPPQPEVPATAKTNPAGLVSSNVSNTIPIAPDSPEATVFLGYSDPNQGRAVGLNSPNQWEVAARFPNSLTVAHAGMELTEVEVFIAHVENCAFKIRIYGEGTNFAPGELLHEQTFTTPFPDYYTIVLTEPITITGEDLWVGYWIDQQLAGIFPAGCDEGPAHPEGDYIKTGAGWSHIAPNLNYNWNIRAKLVGDAISQWLSLSPTSGSLEAGANIDHTVTFNALGLDLQMYEAVVKVKSNDPDNPVVAVPVMMDVTGIWEQPVIGVNPLEIYEELLAGLSSTRDLMIENSGQSALTFNVAIEYPDSYKQISTQTPETVEYSFTNSDITLSSIQTNGGSPETPTDKSPVTINYDGENFSAIGLSAGGTFNVAARFPAAMVGQYAGYTLEQVQIYIQSTPSATTLKIWGAGSANAPGALLHEQTVVPFANNWNNINLTSPLALSGNDIWIGYTVTHGAGAFVAGTDAGPANTDGAWISTDGVAWNRLPELNPQLNYNWNIRGILFAPPVPWITVSPTSGTVPSGGSAMLAVDFNTTDLQIGNYFADIVISSNDPDNPVVTVPVTLVVQSVGIDSPEKFSVVMYPVPATGVLNLQMSDNINNVQIFNIVGRLVSEMNVAGKQKTAVDVSDYSSGVYFIRFTGNDGSSFTRKVVIGQ